MSLSQRLQHHFPSQIRARGDSYFRAGKVSVGVAQKNSYLIATVEGSGISHYDVELQWEENSFLTANCTCPYFDDGALKCKHIWALILTAEEKNLYPCIKNITPFELPLLNSDDDNSDLEDDDFELCPPTFAKNIPSEPAWKVSLNQINSFMKTSLTELTEKEANARQLVYTITIQDCLARCGLFVSILTQKRKANGEWGVGKPQKISQKTIDTLVNENDLQIMALLKGGTCDEYSYRFEDTHISSYMSIDSTLHKTLFKTICNTGRTRIQKDWSNSSTELTWEDTPWEFCLRLNSETSKERPSTVFGYFKRESETLPIEAPDLLLANGLLFWESKVAPLNDHGAFAWISELRRELSLNIPTGQLEDFFSEVVNLPFSPPMDLPDELSMETLTPKPETSVTIRSFQNDSPSKNKRLFAKLLFSYGEKKICYADEKRSFLFFEKRQIIYRDFKEERNAYDFLLDAGCRPPAHNYSGPVMRQMLEVPSSKFTEVVSQMLKKGWCVDAEGKTYKKAGSFKMEVQSGIDWFELEGEVNFDGYRVALPELLRTVKKGDRFITLGDGSFGMLPDDWWRKYGAFGRLGEVKGKHIRFRQNQVGFLDLLLSNMPEVKTDQNFNDFRDKIQNFSGIKAKNPSPLFRGTLRYYQKEGLGWFYFLREFGLGGCLADDMGLGKTVQVLALIQDIKGMTKNGSGPSLVVVPSSLLFNWKEETERFTPDVKLLVHGGLSRVRPGEHFKEFDIIVTTYGTLRRDILPFSEVHFHYVILDEAQAIKNSKSQTSKSVRLLKADYRLALSGTPIENHVGELWSLFEFLNPGILGKQNAFKAGSTALKSSEERSLLSGAIRPFILRRTKDLVAKDLPKKTEQTIYCEMKPAQRKIYDELKKYYQFNLLNTVKEEGVNTSRFQILEALLRLRQAACHPALIREEMAKSPSCKLEALTESLKEIVEEGHKALIFSQFTSFLALLKRELDKEGVQYQYLDGSTRDRKERVDLFQNDESYPLFLISLRAGGVGLNLTRADYVFILDPWWNPAVEAQAIDRAHRIGQTKNIFAYRLICRDTVEERVLALQESKKELAESIITADKSVIQDLKVEDLEFLLS